MLYLFAVIILIAQWWSDIKVHVYAHPNVLARFGKEKVLVVMNHKYHLDWVACWIMMCYYGILQVT